LINASIFKVNGNGVSLNRKAWETFHESLPHPIEVGTKARVQFVPNGVHPEYDAPAKQLKAKGRNRLSTELPTDILNSLQESADHFDGKNDETSRTEKALAKSAANAIAEEKAKEAEKIAKAIQYPLLSEIVEYDEQINLNNPKVKQWADSMLTEVAQLYKEHGTEMSIKCTNGRETSYLPIPRSTDSALLAINNCQSHLIERGVKMSVGDNMSISDGIICARRRLDVLEQEVVSESEMSSDSDHGEKEVGTNVRIKIKYYSPFSSL